MQLHAACYKTEVVKSWCAKKISLYSPAGKMVFSLSGCCRLKGKKSEKYFKDDICVGEV